MIFRLALLAFLVAGVVRASVFPQSVYFRMSAYQLCLVERIAPGSGPMQCFSKSMYPVAQGTSPFTLKKEQADVTEVAVSHMPMPFNESLGHLLNENLCYVQKGSVFCSGPLEPGLYRTFWGMNQVTLLSGGTAGFCAFDRLKGIVCSDGRYMGFSYTVPSAIGEGAPTSLRIRLLSVGFQHACAIDDEGKGTCWGGALRHPPRVSPTMAKPGFLFRNPTALEVGWDVACALDDDGVKCWGDTKQIPSFDKGVREISLSGKRGCVRYDDRVQCWGSKTAVYVTDKLNQVKRPVAIASNSLESCVVDDAGAVHCASEMEYQETLARKSFELGSLASGLRGASEHVYTSRARVLERAAILLDELSVVELGRESTVLARLLVMNALSPFLENIESEWCQKNFLPAFRETLKRHNGRNAITSLADFPLRPELAKLAMAMAESGLRSIDPHFGTAEAKSAAADLRAAFGKAIATRRPRAAGQAIGDQGARFEELTANPKARGGALMVLSLGAYLRRL